MRYFTRLNFVSSVKRLPVVLFFLTAFNSSFSLAQNIVSNPSFEAGIGPTCSAETFAPGFADYAPPWIAPTAGTCDLYSTTMSSWCLTAIPSTDPDSPGVQTPRTGNRMAGIINWDDNPSVGYREYLEVQLTEPLEVGEYYMARMYVSLAEGPQWASNNLGMYFTDTKIANYKMDTLLSFSPQVNYSEVILDTEHWVKVCGLFKAISPAQYLIIGNFFKDTSTKSVNKGGTWKRADHNHFAYYFIDDVSVEKIQRYNPLPVSGVTSICQQESTKLVATGDYEKITWSAFPDTTKVIATTSSLTVQPLKTTKYLGVAQSCGITYRDTLTVNVHPNPVVKLGPDITMCDGANHTLDAGSGYVSYSWQDSSPDQTYNVTHAGKYSVKVKTQFGCAGVDDILIGYISPPKVNLGPDTLECENFKKLTAFGNKKASFHWSTGATDSVLTPVSSGKYWVTVRNQCGMASDTVRLFSTSEAFIPNVVTPNGDHLNEKFRIRDVGDTRFALEIFDRWGLTIFQDSHYHNSWPANNDLPAGVYYYTLSYPGCPQYKSWLQLLH
jgi:gliding motility-associated-like protein